VAGTTHGIHCPWGLGVGFGLGARGPGRACGAGRKMPGNPDGGRLVPGSLPPDGVAAPFGAEG
jgi:hypothetical protein